MSKIDLLGQPVKVPVTSWIRGQGAGVRRRGPQYASLLTQTHSLATYAIEFISSLQAPLNLKGLQGETS